MTPTHWMALYALFFLATITEAFDMTPAHWMALYVLCFLAAAAAVAYRVLG